MSNAQAVSPVPTPPRRPLATPTDYERVGIRPLSIGLYYRGWMDTLDEDTGRDLPHVLTQPKRLASTMLTHNRVHARLRRRYQRELLTRDVLVGLPLPGAHPWPGMADDEAIETAIGRWEAGR